MNEKDLIKLDIEESAGQYVAYLDDMRISKAKPVGIMHNIHSINCRKDYIKEALGIPKGAVVLQQKDLTKLQNAITQSCNSRLDVDAVNYLTDTIQEQEQKLKQVRKETAKEIFETLYEKFGLEEIGKNSRIKVTKIQFLRIFREILGKEVEE